MDFSLINIEKQVIKKTKLSFCFIKNFLGTPSKKPIRRVPEGPGVHLVVVCMGLHESAVFSRDLNKDGQSKLTFEKDLKIVFNHWMLQSGCHC